MGDTAWKYRVPEVQQSLIEARKRRSQSITAQLELEESEVEHHNGTNRLSRTDPLAAARAAAIAGGASHTAPKQPRKSQKDMPAGVLNVANTRNEDPLPGERRSSGRSAKDAPIGMLTRPASNQRRSLQSIPSESHLVGQHAQDGPKRLRRSIEETMSAADAVAAFGNTKRRSSKDMLIGVLPEVVYTEPSTPINTITASPTSGRKTPVSPGHSIDPAQASHHYGLAFGTGDANEEAAGEDFFHVRTGMSLDATIFQGRRATDGAGAPGGGTIPPPRALSRRRSSLIQKIARSTVIARTAFAVKAGQKDRDLLQDDMEDLDYLGDGYEKRPWRRPLKSLARERAAKAKFLQGKGPLRDTSIQQVGDLGVGVLIYFKVLHRVAWAFTIMSMLAMPSMLINYTGTYMSDTNNVDLFRLLPFTLGNHFFFNSSIVDVYSSGEAAGPGLISMLDATTLLQNACVVGGADAVYTPECVAARAQYLAPPRIESLSCDDIAMISVIGDVLCCVVFMIFIPLLKSTIRSTVVSSRQAVQASNYAVMVRGLPPDATESDVRRHFSENFSFDTSKTNSNVRRRSSLLRELAHSAGRRFSKTVGVPSASASGGKRSPALSPQSARGKKQSGSGSPIRASQQSPEELLKQLRQPTAVTDVTFPGDDEYVGGWVAEVSLANTNGVMLKRYLRSERRRQRLAIARANVQRYGSGTAGASVGMWWWWWCFGVSRSQVAERRLAEAVKTVKALEARMNRSMQRRDLLPLSKLLEEKANMETCCGAFVVFNNRESQQRCLRAHAKGRWWLRWKNVTKEEARYFHRKNGKEYSIRVRQAPSPSNIIWEHMQYTRGQRWVRLVITQFVTLVILLGSLVALQKIFANQKGSFLTNDNNRQQTNIIQALDLPLSVGLLGIVVMNQVLHMLLPWLQKFERPLSVTAAERDLGVKMFLSAFINGAIAVLLVATWQNVKTLGFGHYLYTSAGQDVMYAVLYSVLSPHVSLLFDYTVAGPWRRWRLSGWAATQSELDDLYKGPEFSLGNRYPDILLCLFITMTYSSAQPIMLPCAALAFWGFYYCDWIMLMRYHSKPTMYDEQLSLNFVFWLPYALIMHGIGGMFAYGAATVLPTLRQASTAGGGDTLGPRILDTLGLSMIQPSLHLEVFLCVMCVTVVLSFYPRFLGWIGRNLLCAGWFGVKKHVHNVTHSYPSYTGTWFGVVDPNRKLTNEQWELEKEMGITQVENGLLLRVWLEDGVHHGSVPHHTGQKRNTWECVGDYSYRMAAAAKYRRPMALMSEHLNEALHKHLGKAFPVEGLDAGSTLPLDKDGDSSSRKSSFAALVGIRGRGRSASGSNTPLLSAGMTAEKAHSSTSSPLTRSDVLNMFRTTAANGSARIAPTIEEIFDEDRPNSHPVSGSSPGTSALRKSVTSSPPRPGALSVTLSAPESVSSNGVVGNAPTSSPPTRPNTPPQFTTNPGHRSPGRHSSLSLSLQSSSPPGGSRAGGGLQSPSGGESPLGRSNSPSPTSGKADLSSPSSANLRSQSVVVKPQTAADVVTAFSSHHANADGSARRGLKAPKDVAAAAKFKALHARHHHAARAHEDTESVNTINSSGTSTSRVHSTDVLQVTGAGAVRKSLKVQHADGTMMTSFESFDTLVSDQLSVGNDSQHGSVASGSSQQRHHHSRSPVNNSKVKLAPLPSGEL